ncbi:MAG: OmpA family protein [Flavobacteriales bacterium]|nr:OmpA family protein [Flavobacteriales bacterium]
MRLILSLIISHVLFSQALLGQEGKNPCQKLESLLANGKYRSAYKHLVINGEYSCGVVRYAEVLRWNDRYEEAIELLKGEDGEEATELRHTLEGFLGLKTKNELYTIRSFDGNDSTSRAVFAFDKEPIFISSEEVRTSFFPIKEYTNKSSFASSSESSILYERIADEFYEKQEKLNFELEGGWIVNDSILYYGAYYKVPLYSGGYHNDYAIYKWDGKKHRLLDWIQKGEAAFHPTVTKDGWLIFSSNREGGFGGMDLWKIDLNVQEGHPINLGEMVNSTFDEIYPAEAGDSLYYATNDPNRSMGGFDIMLFSEGKSTNPEKPLNSVNNELNPYTVNGDLNYLITDRLYPDSLNLLVKVKPFKSRLLFDLVRGEVNNESIAAGDKVELLDSEGNLLDYTFVNSDGRFTFASIKGSEGYSFSFGEGKLYEGDKVRLLDKNFNLMDEIIVDESGQAKFELLTPEDYVLRKEENKDESVLSVDILGVISHPNEEASKEGIEIFLQDSEGNTIARVFTNEKGEFVFEQVKPDESYSFQSNVDDLGSKIRIFNQDGQIIETISPNENGDYVYVRLKETDKIITFTNEENITVKVAEEERFNLPALYFELDNTQLVPKSRAVLAKIQTILIDNLHIAIRLSGHTDSTGEADYNLKLSTDRVNAIKDYLFANGIERNRVSGKGFGETQLVNRCKDGVDCSEQEHAANRRIEIQFYNSERE